MIDTSHANSDQIEYLYSLLGRELLSLSTDDHGNVVKAHFRLADGDAWVERSPEGEWSVDLLEDRFGRKKRVTRPRAKASGRPKKKRSR